MAKTEEGKGNSKKGLILGIIVLAAIIIVAAVAYNVLAPTADTGQNLQQTQGTSAASASSSPDGTSATSGTGGSESTTAQSSGSDSSQSVKAPDFTMTDSAGTPVKLSSLEGKPMVLNFWASTCGPCQSEMPGFQSAFDQMGDRVTFTMVDVVGFNGETVTRAKDFIGANGYSFPVYFDEEGNATMAYGLSSIPRTFFIDSQGYVVATAAGALDEATLQKGLAMIA